VVPVSLFVSSVGGCSCYIGVKPEGLFRLPNGSTTTDVGGISFRRLILSVRDRLIPGAIPRPGSITGAFNVVDDTMFSFSVFGHCVHLFELG